METLDERVTAKLTDNIARIEFFSNKSNSLSTYLLNQINSEITKYTEDYKCSVIILESHGEGVFCAGASLKEIETCKSLKEAEKIFMGFANLINYIRKAGKFVICKVQGKALGGAIGIIAASDYVLAIDSCQIRLPELSVGIGPYAISSSVQRKIGLSAFSELSIDCQWKDAKWCLEKGLFNKTFASLNELEEAVTNLGNYLSKLDVNASRELRRLLWLGTENWDQLLKERARISAKLLMQKNNIV